jgi:hypothetical protein
LLAAVREKWRAEVTLPRTALPLIALAIWTALALWTAYVLATAWPYEGHVLQILLLIAIPGILFRVTELLWLAKKQVRLDSYNRVIARVVSIVAGLAGAVFLWGPLEKLSMDRFEREISTLVADVYAKSAAPCPPAATYTLSAALVAYMEDAGFPRPTATIYADRQAFLLSLPGGSIDIDGSTLIYDSRTRAWRKAHNDMLQASGELDRLTKGLENCKLPLNATPGKQ